MANQDDSLPGDNTADTLVGQSSNQPCQPAMSNDKTNQILEFMQDIVAEHIWSLRVLYMVM